MNHSEYVFGNLTHGYSQYPDDFTRSMFTDPQYALRANTQIVIHRDASLIYYNYYRRLSSDANQYIGLSVCFNGLFFKDVKRLFNIFEQVITEMVVSGRIIEFSDNGSVVAKAGMLYQEEAEIKRIAKSLRSFIDSVDSGAFEELPALNYGIDRREVSEHALNDINTHQKRAIATYCRVIIFKDEDFNTTQLTGYAKKLSSLNNLYKELSDRNSELLDIVSKLRNQQRNIKWVSLLSIVVVILSLILYFKVIDPSEVSKYQTKEFLYYGPIKDKKPNGEGVAFYPANDPDGRRYYIGNFDYGERNDSEAMLYYQSGDYFYGSMTGDKWDEGIFYSTSDDSHFVGSFVNNEPSDGTWYRHEEAYKVRNGKIVKY